MELKREPFGEKYKYVGTQQFLKIGRREVQEELLDIFKKIFFVTESLTPPFRETESKSNKHQNNSCANFQWWSKFQGNVSQIGIQNMTLLPKQYFDYGLGADSIELLLARRSSYCKSKRERNWKTRKGDTWMVLRPTIMSTIYNNPAIDMKLSLLTGLHQADFSGKQRVSYVLYRIKLQWINLTILRM